MSLSELHLQYLDLANSPESVKNQLLPQLLKYLTESKRFEQFGELSTITARIYACTPHSADCERAISANNCLKTNKRRCPSIETENYYLYVHFNMPPLENFDPKPAVVKWLSDVNRRQSVKSMSTAKTTTQPYFKHILKNALENDCDQGCDPI